MLQTRRVLLLHRTDSIHTCIYQTQFFHSFSLFFLLFFPFFSSWNEFFKYFRVFVCECSWHKRKKKRKRRARFDDLSSLMGHWFLLTRILFSLFSIFHVSPSSEFDWKMREKNRKNKRIKEKTRERPRGSSGARAARRNRRRKRKKDEDGLGFFPLFGYWRSSSLSVGKMSVPLHPHSLSLCFSPRCGI